MSKQQTYLNWKLELDSDHILWLYFDKANTSTNTFDPGVLEELEKILKVLSTDTSLRGLVIASAKEGGFIAGADINYFGKIPHIDEARNFIQLGQTVFNQLAALPIPTIAMIQGFCLGGGLELALACRYRIAEEGAKTRLGLPEVMLGIYPGWGGNARLPRLIGAVQAMDLILTGKTILAKKALQLGILDAVVPKRQLHRAVRFYLLEKPPIHQATFLQQLTHSPWVRPLLAKIFINKLNKKIKREHYPAPYAAIENWKRYGVSEQAIAAEVDSICKLLLNDTAKNLLRIFFLRMHLKDLAKDVEFMPKHVHVVGAGIMGGDIAIWCALQGFRVSLQDKELKNIAATVKRAYNLFKEKLKSSHEIQAAMDRLMPDPKGFWVPKADIIIEAIFENLSAKQELFRELDALAKPEAIFATNTSSLSLSEISIVLKSPQRLVGMHFFNPVAKMPLVEIVSARDSDTTIIKQAISFIHQLDRLPLPVSNSPGFLVNRILMPYLIEAVALLEDGVPAAVVDKAAMDFGMPMGPVALADTVGLDICLSVGENLTQRFGGAVPHRLREMVSKGRLGRKTGQGFYRYRNGKLRKEKLTNSPLTMDEITQRLINKMLNEAVACVKEQVVTSTDLVDAGMIFGAGFSPFRGGLLYYAKNQGMAQVKDL